MAKKKKLIGFSRTNIGPSDPLDRGRKSSEETSNTETESLSSACDYAKVTRPRGGKCQPSLSSESSSESLIPGVSPNEVLQKSGPKQKCDECQAKSKIYCQDTGITWCGPCHSKYYDRERLRSSTVSGGPPTTRTSKPEKGVEDGGASAQLSAKTHFVELANKNTFGTNPLPWTDELNRNFAVHNDLSVRLGQNSVIGSKAFESSSENALGSALHRAFGPIF